jgi:hypothetical protein
MTEAERCQLVAVRDAIDAIHRAFGAPGDYGYGTPHGDALFELYKQRAAIAGALEAAPSPYPPYEKGRIERDHRQAGGCIDPIALLAQTREAQRAALAEVVSAARAKKGGAA